MMVISGEFTSINTSFNQVRTDNKKSQQTPQPSQESFSDVLNKAGDNSRSGSSREADRQSAKSNSDKAFADKSANDKIANDKSANDKIAKDKVANDKFAASREADRQSAKSSSDKAFADKTANDKIANDKIANDKAAVDKALNNKTHSDQSAQTGASDKRNNVVDEGGKNKENAKPSVSDGHDELNDQSASSVHDILEQLDTHKNLASNEKNGAKSGSTEGADDDLALTVGTDSPNKPHSLKSKDDKTVDADGEEDGNENNVKVAFGPLPTLNHSAVNPDNSVKNGDSLNGDKNNDGKHQIDANIGIADSSDKVGDSASKNTRDASAPALETNETVKANAAIETGVLATAGTGKVAGAHNKNAEPSDKNTVSVADDDFVGKSGFTLEDETASLGDKNADDFKTTDDKSNNTVSGRKQNNAKRTQDIASQLSNNSQQLNFDDAADKIQAGQTLNIGDKIATNTARAENQNVLGRIAGVEVTENKQVGDMRVLRIKLNPENLGMVEARLRKTNDGLQIEIHAERQETARLLAADNHALHKALEKSGVSDNGQLTIMIVDKSSQTVQQGQSANSGQSNSQDNSGQNFNGQRQSAGQQGQGGHNASRQTFSEFPFTDTPLQEEDVRVENTRRDPRRLVV